MIHVVFTWRDHPDKTAEECEAHYRAVHMPLARRAFTGVPGFVSLTYSRVRSATVNDHNRREPRAVDSDVDAWVELVFASEETFAASFANPLLQEMFDDHPNFMACDEPANIRVYRVDTEVICAAP